MTIPIRPACQTLLVVLPLLFPTLIGAQVERDDSRPFRQGQVVSVPGTSLYSGDLPHDLNLIEPDEPFHTLGGWFAAQVDGPYIPGKFSGGFSKFPPALLFEGIPNPFLSSQTMAWLPISGKLDHFDFPVQAWWGPEAPASALQLSAPSFNEEEVRQGWAWGGTGPLGGGGLKFQNHWASLEGNFRHTSSDGLSGFDSFNLLSKANWEQTDGFQLEDSFLAAQSFPGFHWYAVNATLKFISPNFQSLEIRPFYQNSGPGGISSQEYGAQLRYHFNMAGLAESQLGLGYSQTQLNPSASFKGRGFVQSTNFADVLGPLLADVSLRMDFAEGMPDSFSDLFGLQATQGDVTFLGDYSKSVALTVSQDLQKSSLGFRWQPGVTWSMTLKYLHEQIAESSWNGGLGRIQCDFPRLIPFLRKITLALSHQALVNGLNETQGDTAADLSFDLLPGLVLRARARVLDNQALFGEAGLHCSPWKNFLLFASLSNWDDQPLAWPDPDNPAGRVLQAGIQGNL